MNISHFDSLEHLFFAVFRDRILSAGLCENHICSGIIIALDTRYTTTPPQRPNLSGIFSPGDKGKNHWNTSVKGAVNILKSDNLEVNVSVKMSLQHFPLAFFFLHFLLPLLKIAVSLQCNFHVVFGGSAGSSKGRLIVPFVLVSVPEKGKPFGEEGFPPGHRQPGEASSRHQEGSGRGS